MPDLEVPSFVAEYFAEDVQESDTRPMPIDAGANLVLDVTQGAAPSARVWWDGSIALTSATLNAGAEITGATGRLHTRGHFDGRQLAGVEGQIALASATSWRRAWPGKVRRRCCWIWTRKAIAPWAWPSPRTRSSEPSWIA